MTALLIPVVSGILYFGGEQIGTGVKAGVTKVVQVVKKRPGRIKVKKHEIPKTTPKPDSGFPVQYGSSIRLPSGCPSPGNNQ